MNKKVLVIAVALMVVAMMATPVMAAPPEKIQLTFFAGGGPLSTPDFWVSGNVQHGRGVTSTGPALISWQTPPFPPSNPNADPTKYLSGSSEWIADYDVNLKNGNGNLHYTVEITLADGTFEGTINLHGEFTRFGTDLMYVTQVNGFRQGVLHGTGAYQGWKIVVSGPTVDGSLSGLEMYLFRR